MAKKSRRTRKKVGGLLPDTADLGELFKPQSHPFEITRQRRREIIMDREDRQQIINDFDGLIDQHYLEIIRQIDNRTPQGVYNFFLQRFPAENRQTVQRLFPAEEAGNRLVEWYENLNQRIDYLRDRDAQIDDIEQLIEEGEEPDIIFQNILGNIRNLPITIPLDTRRELLNNAVESIRDVTTEDYSELASQVDVGPE